jgi:ABC-type Fe3+ transport system permease subunit
MIKFIGVVLILAGIGGFAYGVRHGGLRWSRLDRAGASPSEAVQTKGYSLPLAPIAGGLCLVAGVVVLLAGARQRA